MSLVRNLVCQVGTEMYCELCHVALSIKAGGPFVKEEKAGEAIFFWETSPLKRLAIARSSATTPFLIMQPFLKRASPFCSIIGSQICC
jgi:hypothetical protein